MSKQLSLKDIQHLAELSALHFTEEELEAFLPDFNNILNMIDNIQSFETQDEYVFDNIVSAESLREDEPEQSMPNEKALLNAPKQRKGCFNVPRVVE